MNLQDYTIDIRLNNKFIYFNQPAYLNLESLLNGILNPVINLDFFINKVQFLINNWNDIESIVDNDYGGYWDDEVLAENNMTGTFFTLISEVDLHVYVNVATQTICVEDDFHPNHSLLELPLQEFLDIMIQWRNIII
ncbi:hypothetical protein CHU92_01175 [Flavobacterium cyanobacteriorum]|uniref:SMI1/KNR4 family protein n=1 Tax=Flavobacterium cyanobacteriorum TaxID=2022802 RepID=A0A256A0D2_9FLAO|nr:hypothetical protein [Flavobacterium cyanobacteriorum]OYQ47156.1 hypothetical protein CHU92_01175 [Flavobacterium cyanobacteriorum]